MRSTRRLSMTLLAGGATSFLVAGVMAASPATADKGGNGNAPGGNNGTIKINSIPLDDNASTNANDPHVTCPFTLSLYNFDTGTGVSNIATISYEAWPPSGKFVPMTPSVGPTTVKFTTADWTGTYSFDANWLAKNLTAQDNQGYHVKVSVNVDSTGVTHGKAGDNGNSAGKGKSGSAPGHSDGQQATKTKTLKKHKVFWLSCPTKPVTPTTPPATPSVTPTTPAVQPTQAVQTPTPTPTSTTAVLPTQAVQTPTPSPSTTVLGEKVTKKPKAATTKPTTTTKLPFTGSSDSNRVLLPLGLGFILTGAGVVGLTRRSVS